MNHVPISTARHRAFVRHSRSCWDPNWLVRSLATSPRCDGIVRMLERRGDSTGIDGPRAKRRHSHRPHRRRHLRHGRCGDRHRDGPRSRLGAAVRWVPWRSSRVTGEAFGPFTVDDYRRFIDGKPRYDGVRSFLATRGITLPEGEASDPPDRLTVRGLGNRKDGYFLGHLREHGIASFPTTVAFLEDLRAAGIRTAVVSASRHLDEVLAAGHVEHLFDVRVGGTQADRLHIAGKPDPRVFLEAAWRLRVRPRRAAVVEDALAGVEAGRRGGFALVIGVDRTDHGAELLAAGAGVVVRDLVEVGVANGTGARGLREAATEDPG